MTITDRQAILAAVGLVLGVRWGLGGAALAVAVFVLGGRPRRSHLGPLGVCLAVSFGGAWRGQHAWDGVRATAAGEVRGFVTLVEDPQPVDRGVRIVVEVRGERYSGWVFGKRANRLRPASAGERVWIAGRATAFATPSERDALRHVVGRLSVSAVGDVATGSPLMRSAERVRRLVADAAAATMDGQAAALFSGLVLGDDRQQAPWLIAEFRRSGLSHLTAVSGQNITLLLAAAAPALRRLRPVARMWVTLGAIGWLVVVTRAEPSVLRAGAMAGTAAIAFVRGRPTSPLRVLAVATGVVILVDPLLAWSVGLWLSVGATCGVIALTGPLIPLLVGPPWIRVGLAATLGAQLGVALPSLLVFGRLPIVSIVANLAAVPVAGLVMAAGVPCAVAAAVLPAVRGAVMLPCSVGTSWVRAVARLGAAIEPPTAVALCCWVVVVGALGSRWWRLGRGAASDATSVVPGVDAVAG